MTQIYKISERAIEDFRARTFDGVPSEGPGRLLKGVVHIETDGWKFSADDWVLSNCREFIMATEALIYKGSDCEYVPYVHGEFFVGLRKCDDVGFFEISDGTDYADVFAQGSVIAKVNVLEFCKNLSDAYFLMLDALEKKFGYQYVNSHARYLSKRMWLSDYLFSDSS